MRDYYTGDIVWPKNYYPFGALMPGRSSGASDYRFGFGGQEMDNEISGNGNSYTAEFWQYDSRLGRRWNADPIKKPWESPYATFANNPIYLSDPSGANPSKGGEEENQNSSNNPNPTSWIGMLIQTVDYVKSMGYWLDEVVVEDKKTSGWSRFWNWVGGGLQKLDNFVEGLKGKRSKTKIGVAWVNDTNKSGAGKGLKDLDIADPSEKFPELPGSLIDYVDAIQLSKDFRDLVTDYRKNVLKGKYGDMTNKEVFYHLYEHMVRPGIRFASKQIIEKRVKDVIRNGYNGLGENEQPNIPFTLDINAYYANTGNAVLYRHHNDSVKEFVRYIPWDSVDYYGHEKPATSKYTHTLYQGKVSKD